MMIFKGVIYNKNINILIYKLKEFASYKMSISESPVQF